MIQAKRLTKVFRDPKKGSITAVDKVSFTCQSGKTFGLLGPNGAGKTTTFRMIATILNPTSGTAVVDGYDIKENPQQVRTKIGFLTGDTGTYGRLTGRETLQYFGRLYEMNDDEIKRRIEELSQIFGMCDFLDRRVQKLSNGMKQKVSLARTVIHDPRVLILDEPTLGLDIITTRSIINFINNNKKQGKCILFSTHTMYEAETICDEIAIIHQGKIIAQGTIPQLLIQHNKKNLEEVFMSLVQDENELLQN